MCLAIPGKILSIDAMDPLLRSGDVDFGGISKTISLVCVPEANIGDYVLVHVGVAINVIDEEQALKVFDYLRPAVTEIKSDGQ